MRGAVVLDLGAGTGLTGIVAARCGARRVFLTDVGDGVLANCARNAREDGACVVRELDWMDDDDDDDDGGGGGGGGGTSLAAWPPEDVDTLDECRLIVCADCVYDDALTDALFRTLRRLLRRLNAAATAAAAEGEVLKERRSPRERGRMGTSHDEKRRAPREGERSPGNGRDHATISSAAASRPRVIFAGERRVNFAVGDAAPRAHAHERFLSHLGLAPDAASFAAAADVPEASRITSDAVSDNVSDAVSDRRTTASAFRARRIDPFDVQQRVMYERGGELELWEVTLDE